jgi:glucan phosphorylase
MDKLSGIENKFVSLQNQMKGFSVDLLKKWATLQPEEDPKKDYENKEKIVMDFIKEKWADTKENDRKRAAQSLLSFLSQYSPESFLDDKGEVNPQFVDFAATKMTEAYATSWRNTRIEQIDGDNYFGGGALGIQFIA